MIILFVILGITLGILMIIMQLQWQHELNDLMNFSDKAFNELKPSFTAQDVIDALKKERLR